MISDFFVRPETCSAEAASSQRYGRIEKSKIISSTLFIKRICDIIRNQSIWHGSFS